MASPAPKPSNSVALGRETPRSVRKVVSRTMCALKVFMAKYVKSTLRYPGKRAGFICTRWAYGHRGFHDVPELYALLTLQVVESIVECP